MRSDRGAVSTELAVLTPLLIGFMLFAVYAGRVAQTQGDVTHAAYEAARRDYAADAFPVDVQKELEGPLREIAVVLDEAPGDRFERGDPARAPVDDLSPPLPRHRRHPDRDASRPPHP